MEAILNHTQISDLFFNHEKPHTTEAWALKDDDEPNPEILNAAILRDAEDFSILLGGQVSPQELVEDYKRRL
jgi:hypothetical protein